MDILGANPNGGLLDQATAGSEQARLRALGARAQSTENREGLEKSAREFEAVFMNTLLQAMRKTVPENELFNGGGATKFYRQMHDAELAKALATGHSGMGIADMIVAQFAANVEANGKSESGIQPAGPVGAPVPSLRDRPVAPRVRPEPVQGEVFGPPAPSALERYRSMSPVGRQVAEMARLRGLAAAQGPAVADTLQRFEFEIGGAAIKSGVDPALILAVVMEESGGDPQAKSSKGATGLMQLMPGTAAEVGVSDATSPSQNVHGGSAYLAQMMRRYDGQLDLALAAYNAGPGNVDKAGGKIPDFAETQRYVRRVLERYTGLGGGTDLADGAQP